MIIKTEDSVRIIDVGTPDILFSLYSTVKLKMNSKESDVRIALDFFETGSCDSESTLVCARQINIIRDSLSQIKPEDAIYDLNDLSKKAPWLGRISSTVTSCGNMYLTADGKDLLFEIVSILTYSFYKKVSVKIV